MDIIIESVKELKFEEGFDDITINKLEEKAQR